jgi:hypothetical protein
MTKTALDALYIKLRTVGSIDSYPAGDWVFTDTTFVFTTEAMVDLKGICVGDVNGSFVPTGAKEASFLSSTEDEVITIPVAEPFTYDIRSATTAELGAMTLFMNYNRDLFEILEIMDAPDGMKYRLEDGALALAWSDESALAVKPEDPIVTMKIVAKEPLYLPSAIFSIRPGSEFADIRAIPYSNFDLKMPKVVAGDDPDELWMYNYPNPFSNSTEVIYSIPGPARVKLVLTDMFGRMIATLVDETLARGTYKIPVSMLDNNLVPGVYLCRIEVSGPSEHNVLVTKLLLAR